MKKRQHSNGNKDTGNSPSENKSLSTDNTVQHQQSRTPAEKTNTSRLKGNTIALSFSILSVIVAISAIIILVFAVMRLQQLQTDSHAIDAQLQKIQQQIDTQASDLSAIQQKMNTVSNDQDQHNKQLQDNQQQLAKLRQMMPDIKEDLGLNDIEQLIKIANIKLYWQKDIQGSIALLNAADQQIAQLDDPNFLPVREEIARKRNQLQTIPKVDMNGLLSELNAISEQIPNLAVIKNQLPTNEQVTSPTISAENDSEQSSWKNMFTGSWEELQKFIIIRHHDQAAKPLLPPEQSIYLVENIQLSLMKAQWAILESNQDVYDTSLQQAIEWIETYLNSNQQATQIMNNLKKLQSVTLNPELPNLNDLLELVQTSIQARDFAADQAEMVDLNET